MAKYTHLIQMNKEGFTLMNLKNECVSKYEDFNSLLLKLEDMTHKSSVQAYCTGLRYYHKHIIKTLLTSGYEQNKGDIDTKQFEILDSEDEYPLMIFDYLIIGNGEDCLYFDIYTWRNQNTRKKNTYANKRIYLKSIDKLIVSDADNMNIGEIWEELKYIKSLELNGGSLSAIAKNEIKMAIGKFYSGKKEAGFRKSEEVYKVLYGENGNYFTEEMYDILSLAYPSPFHMIDKKCRDGKDINGGVHIDTNSRFPYMMKHRPMPCGKPKEFTGQPPIDEEYPLWIARVSIIARLKKGHLPCYSECKGALTGTVQYMDKIYSNYGGYKMPFSIVVSSVEFQMLKEHYDFLAEPIWEGGWCFKTTFRPTQGVNVGLADFVDKWYKIKVKSKEQGDKVLNKVSKSILNMCYGSFGKRKGYDNIYFDIKDYFGESKFEMERIKKRDCEGYGEYIPLAIFIVAWSNLEIVRDIHLNVKDFCYCNIDSIVWRGELPKEIEIDSTKLGYYKLERTFEKARFMSIGCYMEDTTPTVSGLSREVTKTITDMEQFYHGAVFEHTIMYGTENGIEEKTQEFRIESSLN